MQWKGVVGSGAATKLAKRQAKLAGALTLLVIRDSKGHQPASTCLGLHAQTCNNQPMPRLLFEVVARLCLVRREQ